MRDGFAISLLQSAQLLMDWNQTFHKTTFVWKQEDTCAIVINTLGNKVYLNPKTTSVWKWIEDDLDAESIFNNINTKEHMTQEQFWKSIHDLENHGLIHSEDLFWGDSF